MFNKSVDSISPVTCIYLANSLNGSPIKEDYDNNTINYKKYHLNQTKNVEQTNEKDEIVELEQEYPLPDGSNKIFTDKEEIKLLNILWENKNYRIREQRFSDSVIHRLAQQYYKTLSQFRKTRRFKASIGWIIDFRKRNNIRYVDNKWYYRKWEVIQIKHYR